MMCRKSFSCEHAGVWWHKHGPLKSSITRNSTEWIFKIKVERCFGERRWSSRSGQQGVNNPSFLPHLREISSMLERNLWSRSAHIQRHSGREPHRRVFWHPKNDRRRTHLGRKSIVETAVNKEEQVKKNQKKNTTTTTTWRCCWASSIWAADASTPAEFTAEPRAASDAMDLKVRCLLLLFTFHVQEGYTGNGEANPGSNRLFQVFFSLESIDVLYAYTHLSFFFSIIWIHVFSPQLLLVFHILFISSLNSLITECSACHLLIFGSLGCLFMLNLQDMW